MAKIRFRADRNCWELDYRLKGKRYKRLFKGTKKEAEREMASLLIEGHINQSVGNSGKLSLQVILDNYLKDAEGRASSYRDIKARANLFIKHLGNPEAASVTPIMLEDYVSKRIKKVSKSTVNKELTVLKAAYSRAIKHQLLTHNPVSAIRFFNEAVFQRDRVLSSDEFNRLLPELSGHTLTAFLIAHEAGLRRGEILQLTWHNIDLMQKEIKVRAITSKTQTSRTIPISKRLYEHLQGLRHKGDHVIQKNGQPVADFKKSFNSALYRADITDFVFHDLRHTFTTNLFLNGARELEVMALTGHKSTSMLKRYVNLKNKDVKRFFE